MTKGDPSLDGQSASRSLWRRLWWWIRYVLLGVCFLSLLGWSSLAVAFSNLPVGETSRQFLAGAVAATFLGLVVFSKRCWRVLGLLALYFASVLTWFFLIPPSHDRVWGPEVGKLSHIEIEDNLITVHNLRNFEYSSVSDFTERWEERSYDLDKLQRMDYIICDWGLGDIAHSMLSFEFEDDGYLCFSVETRKESYESYSTIRGFFRQFELIIVVGAERDLIGQRIFARGEDVYVYPAKLSKDELDTLFMEQVQRVNQLAENPKWYNTLTTNCLTTLVFDRSVNERLMKIDYRVLLNGRSPEMFYEGGRIDTKLSYPDAKRTFQANQYLQEVGAIENLSQLIRPWRAFVSPSVSQSHPNHNAESDY